MATYRSQSDWHGWACIITVSGTTPTPGTPQCFDDTGTTYPLDCDKLDTDKFVLLWGNGTQTDAYVLVATVSGTVMTFGSFATLAYSTHNGIAAVDSSHFVACIGDRDNSDYGTSYYCSVSGTTITLGSAEVFHETTVYYPSTCLIASGKVAVVYQDGDDPNDHGVGRAGTISAAVTHYGTATLSGVGTLAGIGRLIASGKATLAGTGTLATIGRGIFIGKATLAGIGTLASIGRLIAIGKATLAGAGTLSALGGLLLLAKATLSGVGSLSAIGQRIRYGVASLAGTGSLAAKGVGIFAGKATLAGVGSLAAVGRGIFVGAATLAGTGTLTVRTAFGRVLKIVAITSQYRGLKIITTQNRLVKVITSQYRKVKSFTGLGG
ncbi:hypothetical protein ES703_15822 [subsurface metagenome]